MLGLFLQVANERVSREPPRCDAQVLERLEAARPRACDGVHVQVPDLHEGRSKAMSEMLATDVVGLMTAV